MPRFPRPEADHRMCRTRRASEADRPNLRRPCGGVNAAIGRHRSKAALLIRHRGALLPCTAWAFTLRRDTHEPIRWICVVIHECVNPMYDRRTQSQIRCPIQEEVGVIRKKRSPLLLSSPLRRRRCSSSLLAGSPYTTHPNSRHSSNEGVVERLSSVRV